MKNGVNPILDLGSAADIRLPVAHQVTQFLGLHVG
jgi:hypothetical protein